MVALLASLPAPAAAPARLAAATLLRLGSAAVFALTPLLRLAASLAPTALL